MKFNIFHAITTLVFTKRGFIKNFLWVLLLTLASLVFLQAPQVRAFSLPDLLGDVKNLLAGGLPKALTIDSKIELTPDGDVNKNGEIDAGDIVRFTYIITNTTTDEYSFATIKTNINRSQINFIHNVTGTTSLGDDGKTIEIPNFRMSANDITTITFDARLNYYISEDPKITTEAELLSEDKKSVAKSLKKEIQAKRIPNEKIPGMLKQNIRQESSAQ